MAIREICTYPDPVLRNKTSRVERIDNALDRLIEDMVETMHAAPGVGLAANQVGVPLQLAVIDLSSREDEEQRHPLLVIINPELIVMEGSVLEEEGCLSIPDIRGMVPRFTDIAVRALDRDGKSIELQLKGFPARVVQHETDHLDGVLFFDRMSSMLSLTYLEEYSRYHAKDHD